MSPRIVYFGMHGRFSGPPLAALLRAGMTVSALVVPRPPGAASAASAPVRHVPPPAPRTGALPMVPTSAPRSAAEYAWQSGIPVLEVGPFGDAGVLPALAALRPDVICVACFPHLLPQSLLSLPRYGSFNLHPSLLPAYRGPAPLFWIFHDDLGRAGVTVHLMDRLADSGPIAVQAPVSLPDGTRYGRAESWCASLGGDLLVETIRAVVAGRLVCRRQIPAMASLAPNPTGADFVIMRDWAPRRAYNFLCGIAGWSRPVILDLAEGRYIIHEAAAFAAILQAGHPPVSLQELAAMAARDGIACARRRTPAQFARVPGTPPPPKVSTDV